MVGKPGRGPLVTRRAPGPNDGMAARWQREYGGGWLVAQARADGDHPAWLLVTEDPERFVDEVLPLFDDRHGAATDSVRAVPHERLPEGATWLRGWVQDRT